MPYDATIIGKWHDQAWSRCPFLIGQAAGHAHGIVQGYASILEILIVCGGVLVHYDKSFRQVTILELDVLYGIGSPLPIVQDALYRSVSQAFEIDALDLFRGNIHPFQQPTGLECEIASLHETGSEAAVETVP